MVKSICKGLLWAISSTLVAVLLFALIVQWTGLSNGWIKPVMQVIKVLGIFLGVALTLKGTPGKGWLFGGLVGSLYMVFTYLIFSLMDGNFTLGWGILVDLLFQTVVGVLSGMLLRWRNKDAIAA